MKQTLVLQDDEIERLLQRLRGLRERASDSRARLDIAGERHRAAIGDLTHRLRRVRERRLASLDSLVAAHRSRVAKAAARHSRELSEFRERSARLARSPRAPPPGDEDSFTEILASISAGAQDLASKADEKATRTIDETAAMLEQLKMRTRVGRRRVSDLLREIAEARAGIRRTRAQTGAALEDIGARTRAAESALAVPEGVADPEREPAGLLDLRERVRAARQDLRRRRDALEQSKRSCEEKLENLEATRAKCELARNEARPDTARAAALAEERAAVRRAVAELRGRIMELDPQLKALRQENLSLLRKVNEQDYTVHGRKGLHQRFSRMSGPRPSHHNSEDAVLG
jgi:chromosome segregation ATPase